MKKRRVSKPAAALDEIFECCRKIETLAGLLAACDRPGDKYSVETQLAAYAGFMIGNETASLRMLLGKLAPT